MCIRDSFWSIVVDKRGKKRFPIITAMLSVDAHSRQAVIWKTKYVRSYLDTDSSNTRELRRLLNIDEHVKMHKPPEPKAKKGAAAKAKKASASAKNKQIEGTLEQRKPVERLPVPLRPLEE